jgi:hypothetical protein
LTLKWWAERRNYFELFTSDAVVVEASAGDANAAADRLQALAGIPRLSATEAAMALAEKLSVALALPARARVDAVHVAIAAVHGMTFLLTWNCTHLANGALAAKIERTCLDSAVAAPRILTPEQLMVSP